MTPEQQALLEAQLASVVAPGERVLYRAFVWRFPRSFWLRYMIRYQGLAVVTDWRLVLIYFGIGDATRVKAVDEVPLARIGRTTVGGMANNLVKFHHVDGVKDVVHVFAWASREPSARAFIDEMPVWLSSRQTQRFR